MRPVGRRLSTVCGSAVLRDIEELPLNITRRLIHYFTTYKDIPGETKRRMQFISIYGADVAKDVIRRSMEDYQELISKQ